MSKHRRIKRNNRHHRRSRSRTNGVPFNGEIEGIPNVILVDYNRHQDFHGLFPDTHPETIARVLTETWIDPAYVMVAVPRTHVRDVVKVLKQFT